MMIFYAKACESPGYVTESPPNTEGLFYCEICGLHCPVRACHCKECGKCIIRRDHHCPWTGHCIGRDNHRDFLIYVYFEAILTLLVFIDIASTLLISLPFMEYMKRNFFLLSIISPMGFALFMSSSLVLSHTRMAMVNATVWEMSRWDSITYLKEFPKFYFPFNRGVINNIKEFLSMKMKKTTWEYPKLPVSEVTNLFQNELYKPYNDIIYSVMNKNNEA